MRNFIAKIQELQVHHKGQSLRYLVLSKIVVFQAYDPSFKWQFLNLAYFVTPANHIACVHL